jgi:hypothetical protein
MENDPSLLDYIHAAVGESLAVIGYFQDKPPVVMQQPPAVSLGVSGQSSLLIVLAVGLIAVVWATRK